MWGVKATTHALGGSASVQSLTTANIYDLVFGAGGALAVSATGGNLDIISSLIVRELAGAIGGVSATAAALDLERAFFGSSAGVLNVSSGLKIF